MQVSILSNEGPRDMDIAEADALLGRGRGTLSPKQLNIDNSRWNNNRGAIFLFVRHYDPENLRAVKQSGDQRRDQTVDYGGQAVSSMAKIVKLHKQFPLDIIEDMPSNDDQSIHPQEPRPPTIFECSVQVLKIIEAAARGDDPIRKLQKIVGQCYLVFSPFVAYGEARKMSAQIGKIKASLSKESKAAIDTFQKAGAEQISKITESTDKLEKCASDAEVKIEKIIADISPEIQRQAQFFRDEADEHKGQSICWLIATVSILALLGSAGYWTIQNPIDFGDNISLIAQAIFGRAIIFGALGSAIFMCARNYRSHRHNAVVNKHRENALKTYQAFLKEAKESGNPATKAIVLDYAAKCIYAPQETGYDKIGGGKDVSIDMHRILGKTDGE